MTNALLRMPDSLLPATNSLPSRQLTATMARLAQLHRRPGPFSTVYLSLANRSGICATDLADRWHVFDDKLANRGASSELRNAVEQRLEVEHPKNAKAIAIVAANDGSSLVDYDVELPVRESATLSALPSAGLLLEWQQRKIPTLSVLMTEVGTEIDTYAVEGLNRRYRFSRPPSETIKVIGKLARAVGAQLVLLAGTVPQLMEMADGLVHRLPLTCRLITEPEIATSEGLDAALVRNLGVGSAGVTLRYLREQRFLAAHYAAVEGVDSTIATFRAGDAETLLIHENPLDRRTVWIGDHPRQLSAERSDDCFQEVPLVDGFIRCALLDGVEVRMIPAIGPSGPVDDVAALKLSSNVPERL